MIRDITLAGLRDARPRIRVKRLTEPPKDGIIQ